MISDKTNKRQVQEMKENSQFLQFLFQALHISMPPPEPIQSGSWMDQMSWGFRAGKHYIEIKKHIPLRHKQLFESLSHLHLVARKNRVDHSHVWSVVLVDSLTEQVKRRLEEFFMEYQIGLQLIIVEGSGKVWRMRENDLKATSALAFPKSGISFGSAGKKALSFSGNQQWILKYLLLNGIEEKYWPYSEYQRLHLSSALGRASGVAQSFCYETLKSLEAENFLILQPHGYHFRQLNSLMERWKSELSSQKKIELFLSPARPGQTGKTWWSKIREFPQHHNLNSQFSIGGGTACEWYGLRVVNDFNLVFHLASLQNTTLDHFLSLMGLVQAKEKTEIRIYLSRSEKPAIEAGASRNKGAPYVDILQAAFDVAEGGVRGQEQFDKIIERVVAPFWKSKGWEL